MKIALEAILITIVQAIIFAVANDIFVSFFYTYIHHPVRHNIAWGITVEYYLYAFVVIAYINNILCLRYERRKWLFFSMAFLLCCSLLASDIAYTPYRVALVIASSALGFAGFFMIHRSTRKLFRMGQAS